MVRKLVVTLMAVLFSLSVSGLGFAAEEKKPGATPATPATPAKPAEKATQPCAAGEKEMKPKKAKKKVAKKKVKKDEGATMAPEKKPATPAPPAEKK